MSNAKEGTLTATATAVTVKQPRIRQFVTRWVPAFFIVFLFFVTVKLLVPDVRTVFVTVGNYAFTWAEVLYLVVSVTALFELLRVSKPNTDNTRQVVLMGIITLIFIIIFTLATQKDSWAPLFANTEFIYLWLISGIQSGVALMINSRILKRTIDNTIDQ